MKDWRVLIVLLAFITLMGAYHLRPGPQVISPEAVHAQGIYQASGASTAASGTITSEVICTLSFPASRRFIIGNNRTGRTAYVKFNDVVSETSYDLAMDNGEDFYIDGWLKVVSMTVLITSATGITPVTTFNGVGW